MSRRRFGNAGAVTAEFAVVFPAVMLTIGFVMSAIQVVIVQIEMQRLAGMAARELARGGGLQELGELRPGFSVSSFDQGNLLCVEVRNDFPELKERACALKNSD